MKSNWSTAGWNKMPSSCHINPVWHHSEQAEDAQSSHVSPPSTPSELNASASPQHVIFWQTPFYNANGVWRKALSHLWGKQFQRLCAEAHKHRLSWALSCQKTGTNSAQEGTKDILPGVQWPLPCSQHPCVIISYSDCKGFYFPFSVL